MRTFALFVLLAVVACAMAKTEPKKDLESSSSIGLGYGLHGLYGHGLYGHGLYGHGLYGHGLYGHGLYGLHGLGYGRLGLLGGYGGAFYG